MSDKIDISHQRVGVKWQDLIDAGWRKRRLREAREREEENDRRPLPSAGHRGTMKRVPGRPSREFRHGNVGKTTWAEALENRKRLGR